MVFFSLASKPMVSFLVEPQNQGDGGFFDFSLKISAMISWFGHQNQVGYGLSVVPQNRREGDGLRYVLRSSALFRMKASRVRVSRFA
jgi:hypothetical protein